MQTSTLQIRDRLLAGLDKEYNVVNMDIVVEVLSQLETLSITKEALEATRLGKHVNELRRKAKDRHLATRAKSLVKKWRELLLPQTQNRTPPIPTIGEPPPGGGHATMNGGSKSLVNGNNGTTVNNRESSYVNRPSSRLTSPATNAIQGHPNNKSILSPGLRTGVSSSLPSSTSTSPGLSRPTTPLNKHSPPPASTASHPASPNLMPAHQENNLYGGESVPRHNAANKRLRKEMDHGIEHKSSLFDLVDGRNDGSKPPSSKRSRPNGIVSNNQNTSEFLLKNHKEIAINNSLSSPPLQNCDNHSTKAAVVPPGKYTSNGSNGSILLQGSNNVVESSAASTPSGSPQGSSLSPPVNTVIETPISSNNSAKPPPGKRKTRGQRRSEDERHDDILKQQMQSATRSGILSKVRTTQELVQELTHSRLSSPSLTSARHESANLVSDVTQLNETKTELMNRFFDSQTHPANTITSADTVLSPPDSLEAGRPNSPDALLNNRSQRSSSLSRSESATPVDGGVASTADLTTGDGTKECAEDVIARLPPIDRASILAEMEREISQEEEEEEQDIEGLIPVKKQEVEITEEMVEKYNKQIENINGNFGFDGEFREWHEVVSKPTAEGDLLHILPYSVID